MFYASLVRGDGFNRSSPILSVLCLTIRRVTPPIRRYLLLYPVPGVLNIRSSQYYASIGRMSVMTLCGANDIAEFGAFVSQSILVLFVVRRNYV